MLHIDHIEPVAKGGTNDLLNLITSCVDCNSGKSDRQLSDSTVIDKQRQQLEDLQERKEQIELMFQWQKGLLDLDDDVTTQLAEYWAEQIPGFSLNDSGLKGLKSLKRRFEIGEIMEAMKVAAEQYVEYEMENQLMNRLSWRGNASGGYVAQKDKKRTILHYPEFTIYVAY